jgi:hypothetical protein
MSSRNPTHTHTHTHTHTRESREVRSGDRSGQFCWPPRPIHRSWNCSFRYSVTCRLKCGEPHHAGNTSVIVFCVAGIISSFWPSSVAAENQTYVRVAFLTGNDLMAKSWSVDTVTTLSVYEYKSIASVRFHTSFIGVVSTLHSSLRVWSFNPPHSSHQNISIAPYRVLRVA